VKDERRELVRAEHITDADYEIVTPRRGFEGWSQREYDEWLRLPWWQKWRIGLAPGWWIVALTSGLIALVSGLSQR
jgi:hypothetical protein